MIRFHYPIVLAASLLICTHAYSQDIPEQQDHSGNKVSIVKTSQDSVVYNILDKDRSKDVNEIPVPHFAIRTANNKFVMTVGAKVNPIIGTDLGSDLYKMDDAGINFIPSQIRIPAADGRKSDFYINALNADIDFQIVGFGGTRDQITGYIKFSTDGNAKALRMSKAWVTWRGLSAGLKGTMFQDDEIMPPTIDPQGPNGAIHATVNEFGYKSRSFGGFKFGIALDLPTYYSSRGKYWGKDYRTWDNRNLEGEQVCDPDYYSFQCPDIPLFIQYGKKMNRIRLSAILRPMIYRNVLEEKRMCTLGWGLSLTGNVQPVEQLTFYLQAAYGHGIGAYIQDLQGLPISFVPKNDKPGEMRATPMMGWVAGATYDITPKWQANIMVSQARVWKVSEYAEHEADSETEINNYKFGYYGAANVFYNISSYFQIGLEYLYGYRKSWNLGSGHDNRLQFMVQFSL